MAMGLKSLWTNFYRQVFHDGADQRFDRKQEKAVLEEIERIIQETDLTVIPVRKFRKKMVPTVRKTTQYISQLISLVPGPAVLDPEQHNDDPLLRTMFSNTEELIDLLRLSEALKNFFQRTDAPEAFAMMVAAKKEKSFLGTEKNGEIVRRDVPQKAIFFEDFKILAPAVDLAETQRQVQHQALTALFGLAINKISDLTSWKQELERQQELLEFKVQLPDGSDTQNNLKVEDTVDNQAQEAMQILKDVNQKLAEIEAGLDTPEDRLSHLCGILKNPANHLTLKEISMKLSRLGIRLSASSTEPANEFELAEFELGKDLKRVAVWIKVKRTSVLTVR